MSAISKFNVGETYKTENGEWNVKVLHCFPDANLPLLTVYTNIKDPKWTYSSRLLSDGTVPGQPGQSLVLPKETCWFAVVERNDTRETETLSLIYHDLKDLKYDVPNWFAIIRLEYVNYKLVNVVTEEIGNHVK